MVSGPVTSYQISHESSIDSQNISRKIGGWILINIFPSNISGNSTGLKDSSIVLRRCFNGVVMAGLTDEGRGNNASSNTREYYDEKR